MANDGNCQNEIIWKEKNREILKKTRIGSLISINSISPEGTEETFFALDAPDWVIVIPETDNRKSFLMVEQWRHGAGCLSIEFPGGVVDPGETPEEAAKRELREESGCTASKMIHLASVSPNPAIMTNKVHFFLAEDVSPEGGLELDDDEFLTCSKHDAAEVIQNMGKKPYIHSLVIAALTCWLNYRKLPSF